MSKSYYWDELRYLRDVGPEFARANPELARTLADPGSDPDVERVLEGAAFLCGQIRQKLDDELPELTECMTSLLWPHYLRPVPSMSILEILPDIDSMRGPMKVASGATVASRRTDGRDTPVASGSRCTYRTCWDTTLRPLTLDEARLETLPAKPVRLVLRFRVAGAAKLEDIDLRSLRLHLTGEPMTAFTLYLLLGAHATDVAISDGSGRHDRDIEQLGRTSVTPVGLGRDGAVLPYASHSFPGYRLLQEYFAFKEKFLFVDLCDIDHAVKKLELDEMFEVAITFDRRLDTYPMVSAADLRLHCVPVINLFAHAADPISLGHDRVRHLVRVSTQGLSDWRHAEVYSIDRVVGVSPNDRRQREYKPFFSFAHASNGQDGHWPYYQAHLTPDVTAGSSGFGTDTYISFVSEAPAEVPQPETLSLELTCTNRDLPRGLRAGDICEPTDESPAGARFRNLMRPTVALSPPTGKALHWRLISHMSLNYVSLANLERFRELLRVYNFHQDHDARAAQAHERMLEGILSLDARYEERMFRGAPVRGVRIVAELDEDHFVGEGDAFLFATVLDRFMGLYVTLNAFSQFVVRFSRSGRTHNFPARWGEQITPMDNHAGVTNR